MFKGKEKHNEVLENGRTGVFKGFREDTGAGT